MMPEKSASMDTISCKKAIRCTTPSCPCECFSPAKLCLRTCESCKHGWVAHAIQSDSYALDKLGYRHVYNVGLQVEIVQPNIVFDIASLMLYGAQATPIRLKILLDRLFSVLQHEEVLQVLHGFGWSYEDYARGYILQYDDPVSDQQSDDQEPAGRVLDKWTCATREEEYVIMQQFLRFGETKSIAQEIILQDTRERQDLYIKQTSRNESEIKKFIERSNMSMQNLMPPFDVRHFFGGRLPFIGSPGSRLMSPPISSFSTPTSSRELRPPLVSVTSTSPITTSPLGRLQTMQPFDFHREASSPMAGSPGDKPQSRDSREHSPKSESPQNLSIASTSSHSTPPHTPYTPQKMSDMDMPLTLAHLPVMPPSISFATASMMLPTMPRHDGSHDGIMNFSVKDEQDRKNKHLRKSSNPIKRNNWIPDANFGTAMIGPNGKKRVLCTACNKTFCDKGALKIHYSAVHLKEMHKCSVGGCTMMFSSRRSRNRHSANPNPKLHMPQKRSKVPEGATLIDDGTGHGSKRPLLTPPSMLMSPSMSGSSPLHITDSPQHRGFYGEPNNHLPIFPTAAKRLKLDGDDDGPKDLSMPGTKEMSSRECSPRSLSLPLTPSRYDLQLDQPDIDTPSKDSMDGNMSETERMEINASTNSPGPQRSHNRRKNIPIRCAQPTDRMRENEDRNTEMKTTDDTETNKDGSRDQSPVGMSTVDHNKDLNGGPKEEEDDDMDLSIDRSDQKLVIDDNDEDGDDEDDDDEFDRNDTGEVLDFSMHVPDMIEPENFSAISAADSDASYASNDSLDLSKSNGDLPQDYEIPIDKLNPKQCVSCGKAFLNVFSLKIHYKNVHLKLMHNCTVEGCSAAFPSKRSRDRHSLNLNLHRKLLSTSDEQKDPNQADDNQNFRADIIQKLYESQNAEANINSDEEAMNGEHKDDKMNDEAEIANGDETTNGDDISMSHVDEDADELGVVSGDGMATCHICDISVRDNLMLKQHFESEHPKETFHCTIKGCEKIFSTRKSRNRHSQNDNLHKSNGKAISV